MAKTYIDIVKYMVEASFEISGLAEKPDIIGAVFGQTEGLLGGGLDLRELQKNGKIGRIEIDSSNHGNHTTGKLFLPSSLGRVETCILGATIESVDRVGPFETSFKVNKIEDTRSEKRRKIVTRAKDLLKTLLTTEMPDSKEISEMVETEVKSSVVTTFGADNLPAGPGIADNNEVIFVEGRADVINLLKNDIDNCVAVGGATGKIPQTIIDLSKSKETTLFLDGDRGGDMILRGLLNVCDIDFVVRAPDGKEVEELTRKDIIKSLRAKVPIDQVIPKINGGNRHNDDRYGRHNRFESRGMERRPMENRESRDHRQQNGQFGHGDAPRQQEMDRSILSPAEISKKLLGRPSHPQQQEQHEQIRIDSELGIKDLEKSSDPEGLSAIPAMDNRAEPDQRCIDALGELHNTLRGRLYDSSGNVVSETPIRELIQAVQDSDNVSSIVFDGIITQRLIELAGKKGIKSIYGTRAGQLTRILPGMLLYTKEQGRI